MKWERFGGTHIPTGKWLCEDMGRKWSDTARNRRMCWNVTNLEEAEMDSKGAWPSREMALLTLWFQMCRFQNCKRINFCCRKCSICSSPRKLTQSAYHQYVLLFSLFHRTTVKLIVHNFLRENGTKRFVTAQLSLCLPTFSVRFSVVTCLVSKAVSQI